MTTQPLSALMPSTAEFGEIYETQVVRNYGDANAEYTALRSHAALFDHSSLGLIKITGDALIFLQSMLTRDLEYLTPDKSLTSLLLDNDGLAVDAVTIYAFDDFVLLETGFCSLEKTLDALRSGDTSNVTITPMNHELTVIGIEGPYAWGVVGRVVSSVVTALPFESVLEIAWQDHDIVFARSGYTAEYGYKFICSHEASRALWAALAEATVPAGFDALEAAMLEVRQPVLHLELVDTREVLTTGLNWLVDITKQSYLGREALMQKVENGTSELTIGFSAPSDANLSIGSPVLIEGQQVGRVAAFAPSPGVDGFVGLIRIRADLASAGLLLRLEGGAELKTLASPYVVPGSWSTPIL